MKKKIGLLAIFLVLLTVAFSVSSCGDKSGSSGGGVEGTWKAKLKDTSDWAENHSLYEIFGLTGNELLATAFFSGGAVILTEIDPKTGEVESTKTGTYVQAGNIVTITFPGGESGVATISGNTLIFIDEDGETITLTR